jgi:hypothetical protein
MLTNCFRTTLLPRTAILLALLTLGGQARAQEVSLALLQPPAVAPAESSPPAAVIMPLQPATLPEAPSHRFWDRKNGLLFATSAAFSTADFFVTRANLRNGGQELNPVTRMFGGSTTGLAVNFIGENIGVIGISYMFHKTGHHKLERAVSMLNIGASTAAVSFGLTHR